MRGHEEPPPHDDLEPIGPWVAAELNRLRGDMLLLDELASLIEALERRMSEAGAFLAAVGHSRN